MKQETQVFERSGIRKISINSFGVKFNLETAKISQINEIREKLPFILIENEEIGNEQTFDFKFKIVEIAKDRYRILKNSELIPSEEKNGAEIVEYFLHQLRLTVAENAVSKVFVHAGVVGWRGKALVFPGISFSGKTTIVAEFLRKGAEYYSDEYAVLDENGLVRPFPKKLSVRETGSGKNRREISHREFGSVRGIKPIPVGLVFFSEFKEGANFAPQSLKIGEGVLEMIPHTISIRKKPEFVLKVLNKTLNRAIIAKCKRGEVEDFVKFILKFIDK